MHMLKTANLAVILLACAIAVQAHAGSRSREDAVLPLEDLMVLSKKMEKYAAERGARVFVIARQGRPTAELPEGVHYTHVSYAVYSLIETKDGRKVPGYAVYNLYQKKDDPYKSDLVVDFPLDFMAGAHAAKVGVIIPSRDLQQRLLEVIHSNSYGKLHNPAYSAISNPYNTLYQNCTEHVLDVLNAAIYHTDDIKQLKVNALAHFDAQELKISPLKLILGSLFMKEVRTRDHKGMIRTATFGSIANYLQHNGLVEDIATIEL